MVQAVSPLLLCTFPSASHLLIIVAWIDYFIRKHNMLISSSFIRWNYVLKNFPSAAPTVCGKWLVPCFTSSFIACLSRQPWLKQPASFRRNLTALLHLCTAYMSRSAPEVLLLHEGGISAWHSHDSLEVWGGQCPKGGIWTNGGWELVNNCSSLASSWRLWSIFYMATQSPSRLKASLPTAMTNSETPLY